MMSDDEYSQAIDNLVGRIKHYASADCVVYRGDGPLQHSVFIRHRGKLRRCDPTREEIENNLLIHGNIDFIARFEVLCLITSNL